MKKATKFEQFTAIRDFLIASEKPEWAEVIDHELELLEKKRGENRKPTATQLANLSLGEAIVETMAEGVAYTITDMIKTFPCCAEMSTQKVSPVMTKLVEAGKVEKFSEKRRTLFRKVC